MPIIIETIDENFEESSYYKYTRKLLLETLAQHRQRNPNSTLTNEEYFIRAAVGAKYAKDTLKRGWELLQGLAGRISPEEWTELSLELHEFFVSQKLVEHRTEFTDAEIYEMYEGTCDLHGHNENDPKMN